MTLFVLRKGNDWIRENALSFVHGLSPDKDWQVEIKPYRRNRSLEQNALWHKHIQIIASETGNDFDAVKDYLKRRFMAPKVKEAFGEVIEVRETRKANVAEMTELMDKTAAFAAQELGIRLPHPDDRWEEAA